jgi:hypothetical protein
MLTQKKEMQEKRAEHLQFIKRNQKKLINEFNKLHEVILKN